MTTAPLTRRLAQPIRSTLSGRPIAIGFVVTLLAGVLALIALSAALAAANGSAILPGVRIGGVAVGGLERAEAEARLGTELPSLSSGSASVTAADQDFTIGYADLGRRYDLDAMLDAALAVGRDGGAVGDGIARLRALVQPTELALVAHPFDPDALAAHAAEIAAAVTLVPVEASATLDGMTVTVHPSADGRVLAASAVEDALGAALQGTEPADVHVALEPIVAAPSVTTAMATDAAETAERMMRNLRLALPGAHPAEDLSLSAERIASWISFGPRGDEPYAATLDRGALAGMVLELAEQVDRDPVNARIAIAGTGLGGVLPGLVGREIQVVPGVSELERALEDRANGGSVYRIGLPVTLTEPSLTTAEAEAALPQMQLVSSWTTNYVPNDGNGFGANISIGAWDLDGYNIAPGEWFSFWGGIGPVTTQRGYTYGGAIINGRSVPNGALAGGICSTSTTLFNAAMRFGLEIGERENHFYYIDRYPTGLDATVAIVNDDVTDMTFRNDTDAPIVIRAYATPGRVTFQLWSVPNGRRVVLGAPVISNQRAAIETTQLVSSMAPGSAQRIEFPHNGFDVSVTRTVYETDGSIVHQNTWFSDYRPVNGITLVGPPLPAPPPEPPPGDDGGDDEGEGEGA